MNEDQGEIGDIPHARPVGGHLRLTAGQQGHRCTMTRRDLPVLDVITQWVAAIEGWVPTLAGSLWVYVALAAFATIDGFFPPIPSESVVIALASLSVAHGRPNLLLVGVAAAIGAWCGDQVAYLIGSKVDVRRLRNFRTDSGAKALAWAEHALVSRGSSFILAARYIPVGRVAVNMSAGALGYPRRRFMGLTALAGVTWALYGTVIGIGAGVWLQEHPLLAVAVGVVVGTLVGLGIDWVLRRWTSIGATPTVLPGASSRTTIPSDELDTAREERTGRADDGSGQVRASSTVRPASAATVTGALRPAQSTASTAGGAVGVSDEVRRVRSADAPAVGATAAVPATETGPAAPTSCELG